MINLFLFLAYVKFRDGDYKTINDKKSQVENLLHILVHDISNPLTLIKFSGSQIKKIEKSEKILEQTLIFQVLNNLISNCIKFNNRGGKIDIFSNQKKELVFLHIKNNGVGIEAERLLKLFEESKSTSTIGTEGEHGTGFGMTIVKMVLNRFHAKIEIKSSTDEQKHGTEYILCFKRTLFKKVKNEKKI